MTLKTIWSERISLGLALRRERERRGLSQKKVYKALGVKMETYSAWECGRKYPFEKNRIKIAQFFGKDWAEKNLCFLDLSLEDIPYD